MIDGNRHVTRSLVGKRGSSAKNVAAEQRWRIRFILNVQLLSIMLSYAVASGRRSFGRERLTKVIQLHFDQDGHTILTIR